MKYQVEIEETLTRVIEVEANSESEAWELADKQYRNSDVVLGADDYEDYNIRVL